MSADLQKTTANPDADPRRRIRAAYSPELIAALTQRLSEILREHFERVESADGPVLNWSDPPSCIQRAADWLEHARPPLESDAAQFTEHYEQRVRAILDNGNNLHHPRYIGHQVPGSVPLAALFDVVGSVTNQVMAIYEMGPWATAVERAMIDRVGERLGFAAGGFAGLITHGGTLANLTALLTARNVRLGDAWETGMAAGEPQPVLVAHSDVHYGITRAAGMLGIGTKNVIRAPLDDRRRIDPLELDRLLGRLTAEGRPIVAVSACACATPIGAFDPLPRVADVCESTAPGCT